MGLRTQSLRFIKPIHYELKVFIVGYFDDYDFIFLHLVGILIGIIFTVEDADCVIFCVC